MSRTERLNPETKIVGKTKTRPRCRATASFSHMGGRATQQDACQIWENPAIGATFVVLCDGVGGSRSGAEASATVIQTAGQLWHDRGGVFSDPKRDLFSLSSVARNRIADLAAAGEKRAPASTIVALYVNGSEAHWIHAGDSRLYHFRDSQLVSRTRDHSVVQILVDQGEVREEEMGTHPDQGRLLQSLGAQEYREPTYGASSVGPSDAFVLCTDGFWERTAPQHMASLFLAEPPHLESELRKLVTRAVRANGPSGDNVTAALVAPLVKPAALRSRTAIKNLSPLLILLAAIFTAAGIGFFKWSGGEQTTTGSPGANGKSATVSPSSPAAVPLQKAPPTPVSGLKRDATPSRPDPADDPVPTPKPPDSTPDPAEGMPDQPGASPPVQRGLAAPRGASSASPRRTAPPGGLQDLPGAKIFGPARPANPVQPSPSPDSGQRTPPPSERSARDPGQGDH